MFKYVIFDLENTLYDYNATHLKALNHVFELILKKTDVKLEYLQKEYNENLNFDQLSKLSNLQVQTVLTPTFLNDEYWNMFYASITIYPSIKDLLDLYKSHGIQLGVRHQLQHDFLEQLQGLGLLERGYFDVVISSEERDYLSVKCNCSSHEILVISSSIERRLSSLNFNYCYVNVNETIEFTNLLSFADTTSMYLYWKGLFEDLEEYVQYNKRIGERFDLVQAGGGNISFKYKGLLVIKASGTSLSDTSFNSGYSILNNNQLLDDFKSNSPPKSTLKYNVFNFGIDNVPSTEIYMHSFLQRVTVHVHPLIFLRVLIKKFYCFENVLHSFHVVDYFKPGIELAKNIFNLYQESPKNVILLKNHGIVVTGNTFLQVLDTINAITTKLEFKLNISMKNYRLTNTISNIINKTQVTYLSEDNIIQKYLRKGNVSVFKDNYFPDKVQYCYNVHVITNKTALFCVSKDTTTESKIIIYQENLYIISETLKKCKQIEEVLKANLIILENNTESNLQQLQDSEVSDLLHSRTLMTTIR
jgi:ribulose-5-phosphate 4-epimerase/fuculose-1-phosphate aldolase